ncbi:MAG: acyl-CoA desaturase [Pirellulaceae bacterium]
MTTDQLEKDPKQLASPTRREPTRNWHATNVAVISAVHVAALLAFVPYFFSWSGVALAVIGIYVFGTLGVNLGFHRLLTHRGFECPRWLEYVLATLGVCSLEETPAYWVAVHRVHHQHSDTKEDPHSPLSSFWWGHFGWLLKQEVGPSRVAMLDRYAKDVLRDRYYLRLERVSQWLLVLVLHWLLIFAAGLVAGLSWTGSVSGGWQLASSWLIWGAFVRTVLVWHITWSVNSVAHVWGYQNYDTGDGSRNNILIGLLSNGEGWHNNHHAEPRAAAHGHKWWELDVTFATLRGLALAGLAWNVVLPRQNQPPAPPR